MIFKKRLKNHNSHTRTRMTMWQVRYFTHWGENQEDVKTIQRRFQRAHMFAGKEY